MAGIRNAEAITICDLVVDRLDTGTTDAQGDLRIYSGTAPATVDDALSGNTLLAQLELSNPAFGAAVDINPGARATANAIADDASADATGTATFARMFNRDNNAQIQLTVSATGGGGELQFATVSFVTGVIVRVTSLTMTMPEI